MEHSNRSYIVEQMMADALAFDEKSGFNVNGKFAVNAESTSMRRVGVTAAAAAAAAAAASTTGSVTAFASSVNAPPTLALAPLTASRATTNHVDGMDVVAAAAGDGDSSPTDGGHVAEGAAGDTGDDGLDFADALDMNFPEPRAQPDASADKSAVARAKSFFSTLWRLQDWLREPNLAKDERQLQQFIAGTTISSSAAIQDLQCWDLVVYFDYL